MSRIVLGVGASHSTLMNTQWGEVEGIDRAQRFRSALADARASVMDAAPDTVVIVGSNHFRGLGLDLLPAFTLGVGECHACGEAGTPRGPLPVDVGLARHVCRTLVHGGFDLAFSTRLEVDHGISQVVKCVLDGLDVPIVPLVVNVFAPPLPPLLRCEQLGRALGAAVSHDSADKRVVVVASGGLSHRLPFPKWDAPVTDDDAFLVEAWTAGRTRWREFDARRREIVLGASPAVREDFDREFLENLARGTLAHLSLPDEVVDRRGGNGAHEIRSWLVMAAACGHATGRTLAYAPMPEWLTGMAVAVIENPKAS